MDTTRLRHTLRELVELGPSKLLFRVRYELATRSGATALFDKTPRLPASLSLHRTLPFADRPMAPADLAALSAIATDAARGRILTFSHTPIDYGQPIDWHRDPTTGRSWPAQAHGSKALRARPTPGDIKIVWEVGRFPHAWVMARVATFAPERRAELGAALDAQITGFMRNNPYGVGVHWSSGQETAFRLMAWVFALSRMGDALPQTRELLPRALYEGGVSLARHIGYAQHAVYNNHLISEAVGLLLAGALLDVPAWVASAETILGAQADIQFYRDGGYIQQSHTYERVALQDYLYATILMRTLGRDVPASWLDAMARATDYLFALQNPDDGRLPNYGANDGALPCVLSSCAYGDFRPLLQTLSLLTRGERLYPAGPWDEEAGWWLGPTALEQPQARKPRTTRSFLHTGMHVLRAANASTFATFRCGTLRDRFSQIDMLSLDVWRRGENVIVDGGSFRYNDAPQWHAHFMRTASHNTVTVDGNDQMLHFRQFKVLYPTRAKTLALTQGRDWSLVSGEHYGYRRQAGRVVHRRSVLLAHDDLVLVIDHLTGLGTHEARVHWLAGVKDHQRMSKGQVTLATKHGPFAVQILDLSGEELELDAVVGSEDPPRGWLSRHYASKVPTVSLSTTLGGEMPLTCITLLGEAAERYTPRDKGGHIVTRSYELSFGLHEGLILEPRVDTR